MVKVWLDAAVFYDSTEGRKPYEAMVGTLGKAVEGLAAEYTKDLARATLLLDEVAAQALGEPFWDCRAIDADEWRCCRRAAAPVIGAGGELLARPAFPDKSKGSRRLQLKAHARHRLDEGSAPAGYRPAQHAHGAEADGQVLDLKQRRHGRS